MPTYVHEGIVYAVEVRRVGDEIEATIREEGAAIRTYQLTGQAIQSGGWMLDAGELGRFRALTASQGIVRYASVNGDTFTFTVAEVRSARKGARRGHSTGDLTAQMPGQVRDVLVSEGENVTRGQTLVVLEAMKMEIRVSAHEEGRITRVLVSKGDVVERGQVLVEMAGKD